MRSRWKTVLRWSGISVGVIVVLLMAQIVIYKNVKSSETERLTAIGPAGVSFQEEVTLGGTPQWVFVRGERKDNPVILYIHGGPGSPSSYLEHSLGRGLEKEFVVVNWDQRSAGKSFSLFTSSETMTKEQYLRDTHELVQWLKRRFGVPKIYIMGHSWGSYLGAVTAHNHPGDFYAYVGIGQMVNGQANEKLSYQFALDAARQDGNAKAIAELEAIGEPPYASLRDVGRQRAWLGYYGGAVFHGEHREDANEYLGRQMFASPYYDVLDILKFFAGVARSLSNMTSAVSAIDLYSEAPSIDVPVYFMTGRFDYNTPWPILVDYEKALKAPRKQIVWFEMSAHAPNFEEPEAFAQALRQVKKETWARRP